MICQRFIAIVVAMLWSVNAYSQTIVVDSAITLAEALTGTSAPDSIRAQMVIVDVEYYGYDGLLHRGQIVANSDVRDDIVEIFRHLKGSRFPIGSVIPVKFDKPDNGTSMDTMDNTYGFHYRQIMTSGSGRLSAHSTGRAVDINPYRNPAILKSGRIIPQAAVYDTTVEGTIVRQSALVDKFRALGWEWGGDWTSLKDYMHFEKPTSRQ